MSDWVVIPCLLVLRDEFDRSSPKGSERDKGAEGFIGDTKHAAGGTSDHLPDEDYPALRNKDSDHKNEVHAYDCDSTGPWPDGKRGDIAGSWFDNKIKQLIATEKKRWLDPKDMCRLHYIIWRGMIYSTSTDWAGIKYNGSDQHFNHAHFSGRYETRAEEDTRPWGVYVPPKPAQSSEELPVNQTDFNKLFLGAMKDTAIRAEVGKAVLEASGWSDGYPGRKMSQHANDEQVLRNFLYGSPDKAGQQIPADSPVAKMAHAAEIIIQNDGTFHTN
jgi:hypothetical protein